MDTGRRYTDSGNDQAKKVLDALAANNGNGNGTGPLGYGGEQLVTHEERENLLGIENPFSAENLKAAREKLEGTKDKLEGARTKVEGITGKVTAGKDAAENFRLGIADLQMLRDDLRRLFLVPKDPELDVKIEKSLSVKDYTNPENILLLSQSFRETTSSIVAAERLLLSPGALLVLAGLIAIPTGIGYWLGKRAERKASGKAPASNPGPVVESQDEAPEEG